MVRSRGVDNDIPKMNVETFRNLRAVLEDPRDSCNRLNALVMVKVNM